MRTLREIAFDALRDPTLKGSARAWATPYLNALTHCETASDTYIFETAREQIPYALSNLQSWRGDSARSIKRELREHYDGVTV